MRISFETGQNLSTFLAARLVFTTVLVGVAALFRADYTSAWPYVMLFAANTALSLGCWEWFRLRPPAPALRWFALTAAVVLDSLVLHYAGGAGSEFVFLYFFSVGSAGLLTGLPGSLWTATLSSAAIVWLYWEISPAYLAVHTGRTFIYAVNLFLTAFLASYVFARLKEHGRAHEQVLTELQRSRLDTQAILDSLSRGVVVLSRQREVLYFNPSCLSILDLGPAAGAEDVTPHLTGDSPLAGCCSEAILISENGAKFEGETVLPVSEKPIGLAVTPILEPDGEVRGHIVLLSDLSQIKETERAQSAREHLADIGRLSQDLAHEIRNPLATVRGCVEMIQLSGPESQDLGRYLELALRESDRLNGLLRDFLMFAHVEAPHKQKGDLHEFIQQRIRHTKLGLPIRDDMDQPITAEFDREQIALAIDAILLSLAEWGEGHGEIHVEAGALKPQSVRFRLDKKSIPAEVRSAAFRPFSDGHRISNGLALPTAMRAVHAHGGKLTLNAEPGVGTWFDLAI